MKIQNALKKVLDKVDLKEVEMVSIMTQIMEGQVKDSQLGSLLTALSIKGESIEEIAGAAIVMRDKSENINVSRTETIVDTCGTGGDGANTFNISTAAAFVVAGCGLTVAKHGNKAVSSLSGSADVLRCLGVNIDADKLTVEKCLDEIGIGFLFAPMMHGAMKYAAGVRKELGFRTIFNLLGPLTNPAGANAQVIGIYDSSRLKQIASVLKLLGTRQAFVVNGSDGLDEITLTGTTNVCELVNGQVKEYTLEPENFELTACKAKDISGGTPEENANIIKNILSGEQGPKSDIVLMNASAAICAGGIAENLKVAMHLARQSIDTGSAEKKLNDLRRLSHQ
ncbi:MAG: anthranilate phosphoribosyltransferase [Nitrospina sp.]|jgi:anthranilate phosphoribosyltransferase|nr:anthranilate phosphoribosyltransferase [Nitrospina sp.]MBT6295159.1 anthranilate phosphoribosyltransferase [Nitrospina sp.]MBT7521358.1 anthranilate phosphoribosyltransferase [Nitrospina sp.]MDG1843756.1 anthranilate phosphoribosyltransferase [Nitrospinaceae bacterium]